MFVGVAVSVAGVLAAYNLVEPPESDFGNGQYAASTDGDPARLAAALDSGGHTFGTIETATVTVTGTTQRVALRAADATNPVTAPLVSLLDGRLPNGPAEVAISDRALADVRLGDEIILGGTGAVIVGLVENPTDLDDEFVLAQSLAAFGPDETQMRFLIDADPSVVNYPGVRSVNVSTTGGPPLRTGVTLVVNVVSAFGLLEVGLLVGAGFAVISRRRMHQFGLLAVAGATPRQLRTAATGAGFLLGLFAAVAGAVAGITIAGLLLGRMEAAVGHRIDFAVPWWAIAINVGVAVAVATMAARWPSRSLSTEPVAQLLTAQRPRREPVGRPAIAGVVLASLGAAALAAGFAQLNMLYAVVGVLVAPIGLLLVAPLLVRLLSRATTPMPLAPRLAGRSVGRHNRRSAAIVAALALALAIPIGLVVVTSSIDARRADEGPNLADNWLIAWQPGIQGESKRIPAVLDHDRLAAAVERISEERPDLTLVPIETAVLSDGLPKMWDFDDVGSQLSVVPLLAGRQGSDECLNCDTYGFGETDDNGDEVVWIADSSWIATPALVAALGIDPPTGVAVAVSDEYRPLSVAGAIDGDVRISAAWPNNASVPPLLVSEAVVATDGFERLTTGVLVVADEPVDAAIRDLILGMVGPDLAVEFPEPPPERSGLRAAAITIGLLIGVGIALAAVTLFTVELGDDLEVLHTVGAPPRTTRRLASAVAAIVAMAGAVLALLIGYVALIPLLTAREVDFPFVVPWRSLIAILVVFPAVAAVAGWLGGPRTAQPAPS